MSSLPRPARALAAAVVTTTALGAALVGVVASGSGSTAAECAPDARYLDPAGDVNDLGLGPLPLPGVPVDPALDPDALDLREGWFTTNATNDTVTFHLKVTDLSELEGGLRGLGEQFEIDFTLDGRAYYLIAGRSLTDQLFTEQYFELGDFGGTEGAGRTLKTGLTGSFDPVFDTIEINLKQSDLTTASPAQAAFAVGDVIDEVRVTSRRDLLLFAPDADNARGGCAYTIGPVPTDSASPSATVTVTATPTATTTATATATATETVTQSATATATTTTTAPANRKPKIRKFAAKPLQGQGKARAGTPIRFKAIADDPDGDALTYRWDLGDGTKKSGRKVFHTYEQEGQYRIFVVIRDGNGGVLRVRAFMRLGPRK